MNHGIEVHLSANIEKYKQGMESAKKIGSESMGFIASIFDKVKSIFGGMWDSFKSFFSNIGDKSKSAFGGMSESASGAFQKIMSMLPGFHSSMDKTKEKIGETDEKSTGLMAKIGIGLVVAFVAATAAISVFVKKGLEADAAIAKLSIAGDIGASNLTRFEAVALRSGTSITEFGGAMGKLHDEMKKAAAADDGGIFDTLGVKIVDANNALLKTDEVTIEVAKKIAGMSSEAEKYAAAAKVGFEGKVQVLEDIAHATTLAATTTDAQAASVVRLGKIWHEVLPGGKSMWAEISTFLTANLTPAMTDASLTVLNSKNAIVDAFNKIFGTASMFPKFGDKIKEWGLQASGWFSKVAESATSATVSIMKFIAEKTGLGDPNAYIKGAIPPGYVPPVVALASGKNDPIAKETTKKQLDEYEALKKVIAEKIEVQKQEIQTGEALTDGQKMLIKMTVGLRDETLKLTDPQKAERTEMLNTLIAQEKLNAQSKDAKAAAAAASKKEAEAYAHLIAAIVTKTEENKLEALVGENATESQKNQIKLEHELAAGKLTTASASYAVARAKLVEQAASEQVLKTLKTEKQVMEAITQSAIARNELKDQLESEYALYGKNNDAREIALVAIKSEAQMQKDLAAVRKADGDVTEDVINQLKNERDIRTEVGQATLAQGKALAYAMQLKDENKKFGIDYIVDDKARAAASLKIDSEAWQERIKLAGEGTEAQKLLQGEYATWYQNQLLKPQLEAEKKMWDSIESTAHDTFISIFDSGKSAFDRLRDTLKNGLLEMLYQMTIKKWIFNIGATVSSDSLTGLGQTSTGAGGAIGAAQQASSLYSAISTGFSGMTTSIGGLISTVGDYFGSSSISAFGSGMGMSGGQAAGAAQAYNSAGMTGTGSAISAGSTTATAAGVAAAFVAAALVGRKIGNTISDGYSVNGGDGKGFINFSTLTNSVPILGGIVGGLINRAFGMKDKEVSSAGIRGTLSDTGVTGSGYSNWHQDGGWFRSDKSGTETSDLGADLIKQFSEGLSALQITSGGFAQSIGLSLESIKGYSKDFDIVLTKDVAANEKAITDFFIGIGDDLATRLAPGIAAFSKYGETMAGTLQRLAGDFKATDQVAQLIGKTPVEAFGAVALASAAARERLVDLAGGVSALGAGAASFAQNYLTEAERIAPVTKAVDAAMASLGLSAVTTRDQFKHVVQGLELTSDAGARQYISMMQLVDAFAQAHPVLDAVADSARTVADIEAERADLQKQHNELTMSAVDLTKLQRDATAELNRALFDSVQAEKARAAAVTAAEAAVTASLAAGATFAAAFTAAGTAVQSSLASLGAVVVGLADKAKAAADGVTASQNAISQAYFGAQDAVAAAQQKVTDLATQSAQAMATFGGSIKDFLASLNTGTLGSATSSSALTALKAQFSSTAVLAQGGDKRSQDALVGIAGKLIESLKATSGNSVDFAMGEARVKATLGRISSGIDAAGPGVAAVDPMVEAQKALVKAQDRLVEYAALASVTGASTDRAAQVTAGSVAALLASFNAATGADTAARADYAVAIALTSNLALTSTNSLSGLMAGLQSVSKAQGEFLKARDDLAAYVIDTEKSSGNLDKFADELIKSLGLTGTAANDLKAALTAPGDAAKTLAELLGTGAIKIDGSSTSLAASLGLGGTEADNFKAKLVGTQGELVSVTAALKGTGVEADALAKLLGPTVLGTAANTLVTNLGLVGTAAQSLVTLMNSFSYTPPAPPPAVPPAGPVVELTAEQKFIAGLYNDILGRIPDAAGLRFWADELGSGVINLTNAATTIALSAADRTSTGGAGWSPAMLEADDTAATKWLRDHKVPGFKNGGDHAGGWRMVGEEGVEVEATGAARYFNARQMAAAVQGGSDNGEVASLLRELLAEMKMARSDGRTDTAALKKIERVMVAVTHDGQAMQTEAA